MKVSFKRLPAFALGLGMVSSGLLISCNDHSAAPAIPQTSAGTGSASGKVAYVNLDTLETYYEFFKQKKADFEKRQASMEAQIEQLGKNFQNEYAAFQKKAQAGALSQAEGEAAQKKLAGMQQNMEAQRQSLSTQLMQEQQQFNEELQKRLDHFLEQYNRDKQYDYILSYVKGGSILLANPRLDITQDVIKGMNEQDKNPQDTTGKPNK